MPKAILEYTLPEDRYDYARAFHASELFSACAGLDEQFRSWIKHGYHTDQFSTPEAVMQHVRDTLWPILSKLDE